MKRQKGMLKTGCSRILWILCVVFLCAATSIGADDITVPIDGPYFAEGEVNVYADITYGLFAMPGSIVNIYAGAIGGSGITVSAGADVTVHGTDFALENLSGTAEFDDPDNPTQIIPQSGWLGILTGTYGDEHGGGLINLLFQSDTPINLVNTAGGTGPEEIAIDIKPGCTPNAINLGSNGVIPVAILSTPDLDATQFNAENIFLAGSDVRVRGKGNKYLASQEDVNGDGLPDLVVKIETENLDPGQFAEGGAYLRIHETSDQTSTVLYEGWDEITIVPPE